MCWRSDSFHFHTKSWKIHRYRVYTDFTPKIGSTMWLSTDVDSFIDLFYKWKCNFYMELSRYFYHVQWYWPVNTLQNAQYWIGTGSNRSEECINIYIHTMVSGHLFLSFFTESISGFLDGNTDSVCKIVWLGCHCWQKNITYHNFIILEQFIHNL